MAEERIYDLTLLTISANLAFSRIGSNLGSTASHGSSASLSSRAQDNNDNAPSESPRAIESNACLYRLRGAPEDRSLCSCAIGATSSPHRASISVAPALSGISEPPWR